MSEHNENPEWREFERAVAAFLRALGPTAKITHDVILPDKHTGRPRQRDIWIEAKLFNHFPLAALVSCKCWATKLDQSDIDALWGELKSSTAQLGIIYSATGYSKGAIEKATKLGVSCCRLYRDEPPELPEVLKFHAYCFCPSTRLRLHPKPPPEANIRTWNDLFNLPLDDQTDTDSVIDRIEKEYVQAEVSVVHNAPQNGLIPKPFQVTVQIPIAGQTSGDTVLIAEAKWRAYRAKLEAYLLNGSYEYAGRDFKGSIATPWIDRLNSHPGPGWEIMENPPTKLTNAMATILYGSPVKDLLTEAMGSQCLGAA